MTLCVEELQSAALVLLLWKQPWLCLSVLLKWRLWRAFRMIHEITTFWYTVHLFLDKHKIVTRLILSNLASPRNHRIENTVLKVFDGSQKLRSRSWITFYQLLQKPYHSVPTSFRTSVREVILQAYSWRKRNWRKRERRIVTFSRMLLLYRQAYFI